MITDRQHPVLETMKRKSLSFPYAGMRSLADFVSLVGSLPDLRERDNREILSALQQVYADKGDYAVFLALVQLLRPSANNIKLFPNGAMFLFHNLPQDFEPDELERLKGQPAFCIEKTRGILRSAEVQVRSPNQKVALYLVKPGMVTSNYLDVQEEVHDGVWETRRPMAEPLYRSSSFAKWGFGDTERIGPMTVKKKRLVVYYEPREPQEGVGLRSQVLLKTPTGFTTFVTDLSTVNIYPHKEAIATPGFPNLAALAHN